MKLFTITQVLIYNPTLKSKLIKPIQSDIQQAKIVAFYPKTCPIQQKCNCVGMAEGVYQFCKSLRFAEKQLQNAQILEDKLLGEIIEKYQKTDIKQVITMDNCSLALKQVEDNTWLFMKIELCEESGKYSRPHQSQSQFQMLQQYIETSISQEMCIEILEHFYKSLLIFYGSIQRFTNLDRLDELNMIIDRLVPLYHLINSIQQVQFTPSSNILHPISTLNYILPNVRVLPLDVNSHLKYQYFKNVLQSYDPYVSELIIFVNGLIAYSSANRQLTDFFAKHLFSMGQPYKFDEKKVKMKFELIEHLDGESKDINYKKINKYSLIINSRMYGFDDGLKDIKDSRLSSATFNQTDLIGIANSNYKINFLEVYSPSPPYQRYLLNYYSEKKITYLTFYKDIKNQSQIIFQNRFFHDNTDRFLARMSEILTSILIQNDSYRFLYSNCSTGAGKSTLSLKSKQLASSMGVIYKHVISVLNGQNDQISNASDGVGSIVATTYKDLWVYGVKKMNRLLILLIPLQIPLHKLDDYANKMTKEYFSKAYM